MLVAQQKDLIEDSNMNYTLILSSSRVSSQRLSDRGSAFSVKKLIRGLIAIAVLIMVIFSYISVAYSSLSAPVLELEDPNGTMGLLSETEDTLGDPCDPRSQNHHKVIFIKTHKTASTTLATMFFRYADENKLKLAMPVFSSIFDEKEEFRHSMVLSVGDMGTFDVMAGHSRYNRPEMDMVVKNAKYVTIIRNPITQIESAFTYFRMAKNIGIHGAADPFETFLNHHEFYFYNYEYDRKEQSWNGQIFDLGLDHRYHRNDNAINDKIQQLDVEMDLVMLMEYFDESMILLRRVLCWDWMDLIYLSKGIRKESLRRVISPEIAAKIQRLNSADMQLYNHFNKTFWQHVAQYGEEDFQRDLNHYRSLIDNISSVCLDPNKESTYDDRIEKHTLAKDAPSYCVNLSRETVRYIIRLKFRYVCFRILFPAMIIVSVMVSISAIFLLWLNKSDSTNVSVLKLNCNIGK